MVMARNTDGILGFGCFHGLLVLRLGRASKTLPSGEFVARTLATGESPPKTTRGVVKVEHSGFRP